MVEILIAAGVFIALLFVARGPALAQWGLLMKAGVFAAAAGLFFGVLAGIGYHVALYRALAPPGLLRPRWWWNPTSYHEHLPTDRRPSVMPWFYAGVSTMVMALAGCAMVFVALLAM